jgi:serine/threonine-protein kinase RsbW
MLAELTVPGVLDSLEQIRRFVEEHAEAAALDKKALYKLTLAIDEIASNIISYGYEENGLSGDILLRAESTDSELLITLEDSAVAYDPRETDIDAENEIVKPLGERDIGGLGLFLAVNGVDRFEYEYVNNRNRNVFVMLRGTGGAQE